MSAISTPLRLLAAAAIASLTVTGCQSLDEAGQTISHADLVNDLANRLDGSLIRTYTADYRLASGQTATIAQDQEPARATYQWTAGALTATEEATTRCETADGRTACTIAPPPDKPDKPAVAVFAAAEKQGLITPPAVLELLTAAALDPESSITRSDTTLAGRRATCVDVRRSDGDLTACFTAEGALGSFAGHLDGEPVSVTLTSYRETADGPIFELPTEADVVDRSTSPGT
ncbi:hypothetical protein [Salinispora sp. H7-4]|uniref:hypothetical protein n=1 Tax=Salinispora sp. H7-4 TaxID=2748321 RepID=UPI0015D11732|nr:hypothetical protein [Salinispora sp. H7-4]NYT94196.1 hypothetical protein [Salinispora sp. H7-4]